MSKDDGYMAIRVPVCRCGRAAMYSAPSVDQYVKVKMPGAPAWLVRVIGCRVARILGLRVARHYEFYCFSCHLVARGRTKREAARRFEELVEIKVDGNV